MEILTNKLHYFNFTSSHPSQNPITIRIERYPYIRRNNPHIHDFTQLWYCIDGKFSISAGGKLLHFTKGSLAIIPPGIEHTVFTQEEYAHVFSANIHYNIFLETDPQEYLRAKHALFAQSFAGHTNEAEMEILSLGKASHATILNCLSELAVLSAASPFDLEAMRERLESICTLPELRISPKCLARVEPLWQTKVLPILQTIQYVNVHYPEKILADDIMKMFALGHTSFFSAFKKVTGITFLSYLQITRLKACHHLMANTTFSIAYISAICGFSSQSHMERTYKKLSGVLPSKARQHSKEWQKMQNEHGST